MRPRKSSLAGRHREEILTQRQLAVAGLARLGLAVEQHGAFAVKQDDSERNLVEIGLDELLDAAGEIGRVEVDGGYRHNPSRSLS
jgi:hypothetical protein